MNILSKLITTIIFILFLAIPAKAVTVNGGSGGSQGPSGPAGPAGPTGATYAVGHALINSPTCTATSGTNTSNDIYDSRSPAGALGTNTTYTLPASGICNGGDIITIQPTQGSGAYTVTFSPGSGTTIAVAAPGGVCYTMPATSGNTALWQFQYDIVNSVWNEYCPGTNPAQPQAPIGTITVVTPNPQFASNQNLTGTDTINMCAAGYVKLTLTANETLTISATGCPNTPTPNTRYELEAQICQNGTGNYTYSGFTNGTNISNVYYQNGQVPGNTLVANYGDWWACDYDGTNLYCRVIAYDVHC
jgi:hypothetical protein